jgi:hypothetical protein
MILILIFDLIILLLFPTGHPTPQKNIYCIKLRSRIAGVSDPKWLDTDPGPDHALLFSELS